MQTFGRRFEEDRHVAKVFENFRLLSPQLSWKRSSQSSDADQDRYVSSERFVGQQVSILVEHSDEMRTY
ncbi:hypothetical protein U1Q18_048568 [Sarracenia purpurea var. burkii]